MKQNGTPKANKYIHTQHRAKSPQQILKVGTQVTQLLMKLLAIQGSTIHDHYEIIERSEAVKTWLSKNHPEIAKQAAIIYKETIVDPEKSPLTNIGGIWVENEDEGNEVVPKDIDIVEEFKNIVEQGEQQTPRTNELDELLSFIRKKMGDSAEKGE